MSVRFPKLCKFHSRISVPALASPLVEVGRIVTTYLEFKIGTKGCFFLEQGVVDFNECG